MAQRVLGERPAARVLTDDAGLVRVREKHIEPFGGPRVSWDWKEMFIHPKSSGGVLFQLYEQLDAPGSFGGPPQDQPAG